MELIKQELPKDYRLCIVSDMHVGSQLFKEHLFKKHVVDFVKANKDVYVVFNGDLIEGITPGDKRFNRKAVDKRFDSPQDEANYVVEMLRPIKDQILGGCVGNHEITNIACFNAFEHISDKLEFPYGGGIYKLIVTNSGKVVHKYLMCHGKWGLKSNAKDYEQKMGNMRARQKDLLLSLAHDDCIVQSCGHHHRLLVVEGNLDKHTSLTDDGRKIKAQRRAEVRQNANHIDKDARWYIGSGSYRGHLADPGSGAIDYAELFPPADLGHAMVTVRDGEVVKVEEVKA